jgi:hypothetical protein
MRRWWERRCWRWSSTRRVGEAAAGRGRVLAADAWRRASNAPPALGTRPARASCPCLRPRDAAATTRTAPRLPPGASDSCLGTSHDPHRLYAIASNCTYMDQGTAAVRRAEWRIAAAASTTNGTRVARHACCCSMESLILTTVLRRGEPACAGGEGWMCGGAALVPLPLKSLPGSTPAWSRMT